MLFENVNKRFRQDVSTVGDSVPAKTAPDNAENSQIQVSNLNAIITSAQLFASTTSAQLSTQFFQLPPEDLPMLLEIMLVKLVPM